MIVETRNDVVTRYFNIVRGNQVCAYVKLEIYKGISEYEINDLFDAMRQAFAEVKAGDAAPVSAT